MTTDPTYQPKVYKTDGGDRLKVASGGTIEFESGAIMDGTALGAAAATASSAGGAMGRTAGAGGATSGTGGAITDTGGAGTGTTAAGGAVPTVGGAGGPGSSTDAGGVGGAVVNTGGAGGAKTGTGAANGGAGGVVGEIGGAGGATAGTTGTGGAGGDANATGGVGGAATAGTANGGQGGTVNLTPGAGGASVGGTAGVAGIVRAADTFSRKTTVTAMTTSATITVAALRGGLITANQGGAGAATYTMPIGSVFDAAMPTDFVAGDSIDFSVCNISTVGAEDVTMAGASGMVAKGNLFVPSNAATSDNSSATFRIVKESANTFSFYRIG